MSTPILECVPNFSEGRDPKKIEAIAASIRSVEGVELLHIDVSPAAHRTVMTFAGTPEAVTVAAFNSIAKAAELIDMRKHNGVHPRIGATDVCPLIPLSGMTMDEAVDFSHRLGKRVGEELSIPVFFYEYSTEAIYRKSLPDIRQGQYERLNEKMKMLEWAPDYGSFVLPKKTGATVIGARDILVAFNISLNTNDVTKAALLAERMRSRGYLKVEDDKKIRVPGFLKKVRAIGWFMEDYNTAQLSLNLLDYRVTSVLQAWQYAEAVAKEMDMELTGSEVIGLVPEVCLLEAGAYVFMKNNQEIPEEKSILIYAAINLLGLDKLKPFDPEEKVLEYALAKAGLHL